MESAMARFAAGTSTLEAVNHTATMGAAKFGFHGLRGVWYFFPLSEAA
jgi:hypothetical protein